MTIEQLKHDLSTIVGMPVTSVDDLSNIYNTINRAGFDMKMTQKILFVVLSYLLDTEKTPVPTTINEAAKVAPEVIENKLPDVEPVQPEPTVEVKDETNPTQNS